MDHTVSCQPGCTCYRHYIRDPAVGAKISASKMGHPVSEEARRKIGEASRGHTVSAVTAERMRAAHVRHGHGGRRDNGTRSPEYNAWDGMKQRCLNPNTVGYAGYGGRGITVCPRWLAFDNFLADMGCKPEPKSLYSLDRIDNNGNYEPGNCRWATNSQQKKNRTQFGLTLRTHCPLSHELQLPNLVKSVLDAGRRGCLACARARSAQHRRRSTGQPFDFKVCADGHYERIMAGR